MCLNSGTGYPGVIDSAQLHRPVYRPPGHCPDDGRPSIRTARGESSLRLAVFCRLISSIIKVPLEQSKAAGFGHPNITVLGRGRRIDSE